jgi:hypothetical protein
MKSRISQFLKRTPARYLYQRIKALRAGTGQSDEADILLRLAVDCPKTFIEFGFHPTQYNCIRLRDFSGLLIDGDPETVRLACRLLPSRLEVRHQFITLANIATIAQDRQEPGVLSIDVDGNDYWFLQALLPIGPHVISVEYNASLGLAPLTVPYDPSFDRHAKHPSGWYHGASLSAMVKLCRQYDYKLAAVAKGGGNAFLVQATSPVPALDPSQAYQELGLRNRWSRTTAAEQWAQIKHLPFVYV